MLVSFARVSRALGPATLTAAKAPVTLVTSFNFLLPVWGVLFSVLLLGERLTSELIAGMCLALPGPAQAYCRLTTGMPAPGKGCDESGVPLAWERQCISYSLVDPRVRLE